MAIWEVRQPHVRCDVVTEIFSLPTPGSPACVVWYRIMLPDGPSSSHLPDPDQYYLLQSLDTGLHVKSETMWEDEFGITSQSLVTTPRTLMWTGRLGFYMNMNLSLDWDLNILKSSYWISDVNAISAVCFFQISARVNYFRVLLCS